jgi:hypothetical protein
MKYKIKQSLLILLIILILGGIAYSFITPNKEKVEIAKTQDNLNIVNNTNGQQDGKIISMCYYRGEKTDRGFYDVSWIHIDINGDKVKGEFQNIPAEKDSKVGKFEGIVGPVIKEKMAREADVIWDSWGEGMNNKEELRFEFGDGSAVVDFGEMKDRGDGVYVYKDKSLHNYQTQINQIDCENLEEKIYMEKYVRDHISDIAKEQAVLGGTWYVLSVFIDPNMNKGEVVYEDGHLQAAADFSYEYNKTSSTVNMTNFEEKTL